MATHKVNIKVGSKGAQKAAKDLGKVDKAMMSIAKAGLVAGAAYFGARGLGRGLASAIRLAGEQEAAIKQLTTATGTNAKGLIAQAAALQQVTTYGDEAIIRAQALISAFVDDEEQVKKATAATLDLAAAKGMDLTAAADLVSKTLGSSTNAMSRYGIQVEGAVGSSERLESLTSSVAKVFGGQAAAAAKTMTGRMQQAKNAVGDAGEAFGDILAPAVEGAAGIIKNAAGGLGSFLQTLRDSIQDMHLFDDAFETTNIVVQNTRLGLLQERLGNVQQAMENYEGGMTALNAGGRKGADAYQWLIDRASYLETQIQATEGRIASINGVMITGDGVIIEYGKSFDLAWFSAEQLRAISEIFIAQTPVVIETFKARGDAAISMSELQVAAQQELIEVEQKAIDKSGDYALGMGEIFALVLANTHKASTQIGGDLAVVAGQWKEFAVVAKRTAQVTAIIDTYGAANAAYRAMAGINIVGPVLGGIAAAAAITAGLANVAMIEQQQFARGGDFVTSGPQSIMVGDNPGGRERVSVTPLSSPNFDGPPGGGVVINFNAPVTDRAFVRDFIIPEIQKVAS